MQTSTITKETDTRRYAKCIEVSKRIRWEIDNDVIRGRTFDYTHKFLPDGLSKIEEFAFLTCHIELFTQAHYKQSIEPDAELSELYKDVFLFHWREESQHAILDELEWRRENDRLTEAERDQAVDDLIELVVAVDGILQSQSEADANYFCMIAGRVFDAGERERVREGLLRAYRWQYILSGVQEPRFSSILGSLINEQQGDRIGTALCTLI